ncbi:class I SAM-dependent methyltransferase [Alloacidobacterium dinghuense]|uniref:Class I SAM-dependent methyltransferase n=1 Tax=Alloacidobacterium dinghuense TaxID=2763107 RepID=A0A7G8BG11_9BACT|nr:class I SAM-dependent methyltransferase [Alloacidobacterium dinghuense]QNI31481.1 class I SAM-dependent methyltransferase [Alloacidobacterium dinghuense]
MDAKTHWETVHGAESPSAVSWYRPHLETSLSLIERAGAGFSASILDVGGGQSTLIDDLLVQGYRNLSVLDISSAALEGARKRLGANAGRIEWITADVTQAELPPHAYDIWHDRAVFHFLTSEADRAAYIRQAIHALKPGGHVILATFALSGPARCSGLEVVRYSSQSLAQQLGESFRLIESTEELHETPTGAVQPFVYSRFQAV